MAGVDPTEPDGGGGPRAQPSVPKVALQEYVDARFASIADAVRTAEQEREKSAEALRAHLEQQLTTGDERLRDHIAAQMETVRTSLVAADLLERERISLIHEEIEALSNAVRDLFAEKQKALDAALIAQKEAVAEAKVATDRIAIRSTTDQEGLRADMQERLAAVRRELEQATAAQKEAVLKAETANEKRFQSVDEWKASSADRERTQAEVQAKLVAQFMPREVSDAQMAELRRLTDAHYKENQGRVQTLEARLDKTQGQSEGSRQSVADRHQGISSTTAMLTVALTFLAILVTIAVATHGFR